LTELYAYTTIAYSRCAVATQTGCYLWYCSVRQAIQALRLEISEAPCLSRKCAGRRRTPVKAGSRLEVLKEQWLQGIAQLLLPTHLSIKSCK